ncbi:hypothetical protein [Mycobacterium sp. ZZG]
MSLQGDSTSLSARFVRAVLAGPEEVREFANWCQRALARDTGRTGTWLYLARALWELDDPQAKIAYNKVRRLKEAANESLDPSLRKEIAQRTGAQPRKQQAPPSSPATGNQPTAKRPDPSTTKSQGTPSKNKTTKAVPAAKQKSSEKQDASLAERQERNAAAKRRTESIQAALALSRSGEHEKALDLLRAELANSPEDKSLLHAVVDTFRRAQRHTEAEPYYDRLFKLRGSDEGARTHWGVQLGHLYIKAKKLTSAKQVLAELEQGRRSGSNPGVQRLRLAITDYEIADSQVLVVDEDDDGIDSIELTVSPLLAQDILDHSIVDAEARELGGNITEPDVARLILTAKTPEVNETTVLTRYLDAAKALSQLSAPRSQKNGEVEAGYALAKAAETIKRFDDLHGRNPRSSRLAAHRDYAVSYLREALRVYPNRAFSRFTGAFRNVLRISMVVHRLEIDPDADIRVGPASSDLLTTEAFSGNDDPLLREYLDTVIYLLSARPTKTGAIINGLKLKEVLRIVAHEPDKLRSILRDIVGPEIESPDVSSDRLVREAAFQRLHAIRRTEQFFAEVRKVNFNTNAPGVLISKWSERPTESGTWTRTDNRELIQPLTTVLDLLDGIERKSDHERNAILSSVRSRLEDVHRSTRHAKTYICQAQGHDLVGRWLEEIRVAEAAAQQALQPDLVVKLDPPFFHFSPPGGLKTTLFIENKGRASASNYSIKFTYDTPGFDPHEFERVETFPELGVGQSSQAELELSVPFPGGIEEYRGTTVLIETTARGQFSNDIVTQTKATIDIAGQCTFGPQDIPWNYGQTPKEELFLGRWPLIGELSDVHFTDPFERTRTLLLYGLTRTGKTSIRDYLALRLRGAEVPGAEPGTHTTLVPVIIDLDAAARMDNISDLVGHFIQKLAIGVEAVTEAEALPNLEEYRQQIVDDEHNKWADWENHISNLRKRGFTCIVMIDEFTQFAELASRQLMSSAFLSMIRAQAFGGDASFVLVGAFGLRSMLHDPAFGDAGQLVNVVERRIGRIDREATVELIGAMGDQLTFTQPAIEEIVRLSGCVPYFVQWICRECAFYALHANRNMLGAADITLVANALVSPDAAEVTRLHIQGMNETAFLNNMYNPTDPLEIRLVTSVLCNITKDEHIAHPVSAAEIISRIGQMDESRTRRINSAIATLVDRGIIEERNLMGEAAYVFGVDLFRRFWLANHNLDLTPQLMEFQD